MCPVLWCGGGWGGIWLTLGDFVFDVSGFCWVWRVMLGVLLLCEGEFVGLELAVLLALGVSVVWASLCNVYGLAGGMHRGV